MTNSPQSNRTTQFSVGRNVSMGIGGCFRNFGAIGTLGIVCLSVVLTGSGSLASAGGPQIQAFNKGASQFCIANLSAEDQTKYFSRIVNIGASFGHGCMGCDSNKVWQGYTEMTDDQFWVRRNFLSHFFEQAPWKRPEEFRFEKFYILENDGKTKPSALVSEEHIKNVGYSGEWIYDPATSAFGLLSGSMKNTIQAADPNLVAEGEKVGGALNIKDPQGKMLLRKGPLSGTLFRTVPGKYAASGAVPKSVIDLSVDGGFLGILFALHADKDKVAALEATRWQDPVLRNEVVNSLALRMSEIEASVILGVDLLFWDTVFESIYRLKQAGPQSPLIKVLLGVVGYLPIGKQIFDQGRRDNQRADLYRALALVSQGYKGRKPVPVLLARLADDPIKKFKDKDYMPVLATLFGQFFEQVTGVNLITEILVWLGKISYIQNSANPSILGNIPRETGFEDAELGLKLTAGEVKALRQQLEAVLEQIDIKETESENTLLGQDLASRARFSFDPAGGSQVTMFPAFTTGIVSKLMMQVLVDVPGFVAALAETFKQVNNQVSMLSADTSNNVHELDVNEFYENLGYFLNPRTAHPSILGATRMARMVERTICGSPSF